MALMEYYKLPIAHGRRPAFDDVPAPDRRRAFGVDYVALRGLKGGELLFTRQGWEVAESIVPAVWYHDQQFHRIGRPLVGGTGSVYHVPVPHPSARPFGLVIKFCRFGQDVGVTAPGLHPFGTAGANAMAGAEFLGPFEEFGNLQRLREAAHATNTHLYTKRALGIYIPPTRYPQWRTGRDTSTCWHYDRALAADQAKNPEFTPVRHDWEKLYVLIYQWIEGIDAEEARKRDLLDDAQLHTLTHNVAHVLQNLGFFVIDHKPKHIILRPVDNSPDRLRHDREGRLLWALIDYELLLPLPGKPAAQPE